MVTQSNQVPANHWPAISVALQVALYNAFHRQPANRLIHGLTVPLILASGMMVTAPLRLPGTGDQLFPISLALALVSVMCLTYLSLELVTGLVFSALAFPTLLLMNLASQQLSLVENLLLNALVQGVAWYVTVVVGHGRFEGEVEVRSAPGDDVKRESSNIYFDRGYFVLRNIGRPATLLESLQQFAVGPFASTLDVLFTAGYAPALRAQIASLTVGVLGRLARGEDVLAAIDEPVGVGARRAGATRRPGNRSRLLPRGFQCTSSHRSR